MLRIALGILFGLMAFFALLVILYIGVFIILVGGWTAFFDAAGFVATPI